MNKDDALFALFLVLFHHFTKLVQLVIQYFTVAHAAGVIQQLADMQVNLDNPILAPTFDDRLQFGWSICRFFLYQSLLQFLCRNIHLLGRLVIPDNIIHQGRCFKENRLLECMQFIELYHIYADFHTDSRFHCERTVIFECHQLYHHTFTVVQLGLFELLQQKFRIRLYQTMRTDCPGLSFSTRIGIIHIIITVVHQICLERCSADSLDILRNKSQKNIQDISAFHLGLTINRYLRFLQTDRLRL